MPMMRVRFTRKPSTSIHCIENLTISQSIEDHFMGMIVVRALDMPGSSHQFLR